MTFKQLEYLIKTSEYHSLNKAAEALFISQPSLNYALRTLEKELNLQLFIRSKNGIVLTRAGEIILEDAKHILSVVSGWEDLAESDTSILTLIGESIVADDLIPDIVLACLENQIQLQSFNRSVREILSAPASEEPSILLDLVSPADIPQITMEAAQNGWAYSVVASGNSVILTNSDTLASKKAVSLNDLKDGYTLITRKPDAIYKKHWSFISSFEKKQVIFASSRNAEIKLLASTHHAFTTRSFLFKKYANENELDFAAVELLEQYLSDSLIAFYPANRNQRVIDKILTIAKALLE